jgi:hypothetical protein
VGAAVGRGRCRRRRRVARRVEATGRREHGTGADDAVHSPVRPDAHGRRGDVRRVPASGVRSTASCSECSTRSSSSCSVSCCTPCRRETRRARRG